MKYLSILVLVLFSVAAQSQAAPSPTMSLVSAELVKKIDTKNAHVGDAVLLKTTAAAALPNGTQLPKGTKLTGKLTEVRPKSSADKNSHMAFNLDRVVLSDGSEVPIRTSLSTLTVPSVAAETAQNEVSAGSSMPTMRGSGGGAPTSTLSSGASRSTEAVSPQTRTALGNGVTSTAPPTDNAATSMAATNGSGKAVSGPHLDHVPVAYMPGMSYSSALNDPTTTGSVDATGQNISIDSGTKMTLVVQMVHP